MNIISLFSGAGGLDLGLIQAGHHIVWANDIDANAVATYRANVDPNIIQADIREINIEDIPDADVVVGGFPCQGFSMANMRRNIDDERNLLYQFFYHTIQIKQPSFFIAENVKGILSLGGGAIMQNIINNFNAAGYRVEYHLVNMANYGVPQHRERVIIVGQRNDLGDNMLFHFPEPTHTRENWVSIRQALENLPPAGNVENDPNNYGSNYRIVVKNFTAHRITNPDLPSPTILARGNGKGGVCAIPHYNGERRLTIRESAVIQTFPLGFNFIGNMGSCYRQIGNAVPVHFGEILGNELTRIENQEAWM